VAFGGKHEKMGVEVRRRRRLPALQKLAIFNRKAGLGKKERKQRGGLRSDEWA